MRRGRCSTPTFPKNGCFLICAIFTVYCLTIGLEKPKNTKDLKGPASPRQEHKSFHLAPGLRMELVASEPQVQSPVAMQFAPDGKLWVVEMHDYPNGPAAGKPPQGRIVVLQDRDGDGHFEHSKVFADKLLFANGLLLWRDGALVTQAPNIVHLRDTDGDGKADRRDVLYEGFAAKNPQLRVSHPNLGIDNWIYVANGLRGGSVRAANKPKSKPINISGMDFRFNLITGEHEAISGMGQYGNTFDDWGNRFVCDNRHHLRHVAFPNRYLKRNPFLAVSQVLEDPSELDDGPLSSGGKVYPLSKNWTTSNLHAGRFTAACGVYVYRSGLLPRAFYGNALTCDPTGNLVHREILKPRGATFSSHPARKGVEFLASTHDWFRPVFLTDGPDGALYVVDMYRAVIEHPQFMPPELKNRPDLIKGKNHGRIWRIVPAGHKIKPVRPCLQTALTAKLVELLSHANTWQRQTAQRLLLQKNDKTAIGQLRKLLTTGKDPRGRLHAAWLLDAFGSLGEQLILQMLKDKHPRLREHAVVLAESRLAKSSAIRNRVTALANDRDARVRFQTALCLGQLNDDRILEPLAKIAMAGAEDRWTRYAVASAVPNCAGPLLSVLLRSKNAQQNSSAAGRSELVQELAVQVGARRDVTEVTQTLQSITGINGKQSAFLQITILDGLVEGMRRRGTRFATFLKTISNQKVAGNAAKLLAGSAAVAENKKLPAARRLTALRLLTQVSWADAKPALLRLMKKNQAKDIRLAAVRALSDHNEPEIAGLLLKSYRTYTPSMRIAVTGALLRRTDRINALLGELQAGRLKPGEIDVASTRRLLRHGNAKIRAQAAKLLQAGLPAPRKKVLAQYQPALKIKGDPHKGKLVFKKHCATCHRIGGEGVDVGPVISDTRTKKPADLLNSILNPNQAIDNNYVNYLVVTKDGKTLNGLIVTETASSITLKRANNETDVVLRQDIDEITSSGASLMPEGLEKNIPVKDMADLISYLKNWRYLDGSVPPGVGSGVK